MSEILDRLPLLPEEQDYIRQMAARVRGSSESPMAIAAVIAMLVSDGIQSRQRFEKAAEKAA